MKNHPRDEDQVSQAASLMGKRSWKARLKRYGVRKLKRKLSAAGKAAKNSGRPRLPDDQVTPIALYQRARRARLKAITNCRPGGEITQLLNHLTD